MKGARSVRHEYQRCASSDSEDSDVEFPEALPACLLSSWGVPQEVKEVMAEKQLEPDPKLRENGHLLTMFDISGPVVHLLWVATLLLWPFLILLPMVAFNFTECNGLAIPKYELKVWLIALPFLFLVVLLELRAFTYTVVPMMQWQQSYSVMGVPLPPRCVGLWFAWNFFLTLAAKTELVTQCLLLASAARWFTCPSWDSISGIWQQIWDNSVLSQVQIGSDLRYILVLTWVAMLVQLPLFLAGALPVRCCRRGRCVDFECRAEKDGYEVCACWPENYTIRFAKVWHADVVRTLSSLDRMSLLTEGQFQRVLERAKLSFEGGDSTRGFQILKMQMQTMIPRICLVNFLQNGIKLEVQTTLFCLGRVVSPERLDWRCLFCLLLSQLTSWNELGQIVQKIWQLGKIHGSAEAKDAKNRDHQWMVLRLPFVWCVVALCALVQLHAFGKLLGAFGCHDSVWNFPNRCVDIKGF